MKKKKQTSTFYKQCGQCFCSPPVIQMPVLQFQARLCMQDCSPPFSYLETKLFLFCLFYNRGQLQKIPRQNQLNSTKRNLLFPDSSGYSLKLVKEVRIYHRDFINDQVFTASPLLGPPWAQCQFYTLCKRCTATSNT